MSAAQRFVACTMLFVLMALLPVSGLGEPADSTDAREPVAPKKSTGDVLLDIPQYILSVPVYIVQGLAHGTVYVVENSSGIRSFAASLFDPSRPIAPVASFGDNEGLVGGLRYQRFDLFTPTDRFRIKSTYSTTNYSLFNIKYEDLGAGGGRAAYTLQGGYSRHPRTEFYGVGNDSDKDSEGSYTREQFEIRADLGWRLSDQFTVGTFGTITRVNIFDGHDPDAETSLPEIQQLFTLPPSSLRSAQFGSLGARLDLDFRNLPGQPSKGGRYIGEFAFYSGFGDKDDIEFTRSTINVQQFVELWDKRILAVRAIVQDIDRTEDVSPNPVYLLNSLGGANSLRGYEPNRFIDRDMALFTVEYRYPIWDVIDAFIFLDEGRVFDKISEHFTWRDWRYSAGFGLRVWTPRAVVASAQVAKGDEGWRFYFEFGDDF